MVTVSLFAMLVLAVLQQPADTLPTLVLGPGEGAWVVRIVTSGGFSGRGAGNFTASSAGDMVCVSAGSCPQHLAPEARQSLARLVASIGVEVTTPRASPLHPGTCSDCVSTTMTIHRRDHDGERSFTYTWDVSTASSVPEDALRLHSAMIALADSRAR